MRLTHCFVFLAATWATKIIDGPQFQKQSERPRIGLVNFLKKYECGPTVVNLDEEYCFFKEQDQKWSLIITAPSNPSGSVLSQLMIREAHNSYYEYGFQRVAALLQYSLWPFLVMKSPQDAQAGAVYVTHNGGNLEIIGTWDFTAGLYRNGELIKSRELGLDDKIPYGSPVDYFHQIDPNGNFALHDLKETWKTQTGDILVISEEYFPLHSQDIIKEAVKDAEGKKNAVCLIVLFLNDFFNGHFHENRVFAAVRI